MNHWKRILLGLTLFLTITAAAVYGVYQYTLNRYADQLNNALGAIAQEPPASDPLPIEPDSPAPTPSSNAGTVNPPAAPPQVTPPAQPPKPPVVAKPAGTTKPPGPDDTGETTPTPEEDMVDQATANLNLSTSEKADVSLALDVLGKMSMTEKLFFFQTVGKFSPPELLEMYHLYKQGDMAQVKAKLESRFTAEDLERIKEIAEKYQPTE